MSISIASNRFSLQALSELAKTNDRLAQTQERLATGLRINSAVDDPGGLALAERLRADSKIAQVAIQNASDGLSFVSINDEALSEISNILYRMAELASQSTNRFFTNTQRSALSSEFIALGSEINRIALTTNYNDINMLSAGRSASIQVGFNSFSTSQITVGGVTGDLGALNLGESGQDYLNYSIIDNTENDSVAAARTALEAVRAAIEDVDEKRGLLGADESRLSHAVNHLEVARENFISAESKIREIDPATELANLVKDSILQNVDVALAAQANIQPAQALELLQLSSQGARQVFNDDTPKLGPKIKVEPTNNF